MALLQTLKCLPAHHGGDIIAILILSNMAAIRHLEICETHSGRRSWEKVSGASNYQHSKFARSVWSDPYKKHLAPSSSKFSQMTSKIFCSCYVLSISGYNTAKSIFFNFLHQISVVSAERRICFETECIMTLQGHPRSLILAPIESAYRTSYWFSIVTLMLSRHVSEILEFLYAKSHFFRTPPLFRPKFWGVPVWVDPWYWGLQRANTPG